MTVTMSCDHRVIDGALGARWLAGVRRADREAGVARAVSDARPLRRRRHRLGPRRLRRRDPLRAARPQDRVRRAREPRRHLPQLGLHPDQGAAPLRRGARARSTTRRSSASSSATSRADFPAIIARSRGIADKVSKGVGFLFRKNKIEHVAGTAKLLPRAGAWKPHQIEVASAASGTIARGQARHHRDRRARALAARHRARRQAHHRVPQGDDAADAAEVAGRARRGRDRRRVRVVLPLARHRGHDRRVPAAPGAERGLRRSARSSRSAFDKRGIKLARRSQADDARRTPATRSTIVGRARRAGGAAAQTLEADILLVAVGIAGEHREPRPRGARHRSSSAASSRSTPRTAAATACGRSATSSAAASRTSRRPRACSSPRRSPASTPSRCATTRSPRARTATPEIASVGLTEEKAKAQNIPIKVGRVPVPRARARRVAAGETTGFVKVIWHAETGALVGAHLIGPAVTDLIAELTLAKTTEVNAESHSSYTIHAHPTFAEAIKGATEDALGHAIDL